MKHNLRITTPSDHEIAMIRDFDAPRPLVFDCLTKPELVRRWLTGPDGWEFRVCDIDLRVGGSYRYVWYKAKTDTEMSMGGVYREIVAPERIVHTERFDDPWYPGEALVTSELVEAAGRTTLTTTMRLATREARDGVLATGMEGGVATSYDRLDEVLASLPR